MVLKEYYKSSYSNLLARIQQLNKIYQENNQINNEDQNSEKLKNACFLGLCNFGNTCFINTIMISILNIKTLADSIMDTRTYYKSIITSKEFIVYDSLVNLFEEYHKNKLSQTSLDQVMLIFCQNFYTYFSAQFKINIQEDANYFLTTIFSMIDDVYGEIDTIIQYDLNKDYGIEKGLFIDKFFNMQIINEFKCHANNHKSVSYESEMILTLDIINCLTLEDSIDLYFQNLQLIDRENLFFCSTCQNNVLAEKSIRINNLPNILIIYLKIFDSNVNKIKCIFYMFAKHKLMFFFKHNRIFPKKISKIFKYQAICH